MKLKNIFIALMVVLTAAVACVKEETGLTEIKVSKSFVNIPPEGGSDAITLKTTGDWSLAIKWPSKKVDGKYVDDKWFEVTTEQNGDEEIVTFSAEASAAYRSLDIKLYCNGQTQIIKVAQGKDVPVPATIKEVLAERAVGKQYRLDQVKVLKIKDMTFGKMDITDKTGEVCEIYGFLNDAGEKGKFPEMKIAEGDILNIKAKWSSYNNLENAMVIEHFPSYVAPEKGMDKFNLEKEAQEIEVKLKVSGNGLDVDPVILVPVEGADNKFERKPCSWISVKGINVVSGKGTVTLRIGANDGLTPREAVVYFTSGVEDKPISEVATTIVQKGNVPAAIKISEAKSKSYVNISGVVAGVSTNGYILKDETASIFVYNKDAKFAVGTKLQVVGAISGWNFGAQVKPDLETADGTVEVAHGDAVVLDPAKLDEIAALTDGKDKVKDLVIDCQYVKITGKLTQSTSNGQTYWNIIVPNSGKKGSGYGLSEEMAEKATPFIDKDVDIHGYLVQVSNGKYFNIVVTGIAAVSATPDPDPETPTGNEATLDCTAAGFADWTTSYIEHTQDFEKATVTYEAANKQPENNAITDCPVTKGKYVIVKMKGDLTMKSVDFTFKQWGTKKQTATLHTSTNGVDFTETTITSDNFALSSAKLPEGTKAVKVTFGNGNQIGIKSIKVGF